MKKRIVCFFLVWVFTICSFTTIYARDIEDTINATGDYIMATVDNPQVSAIGGEWSVIGLARSGLDVPDEYYERYYKNLESYVKENKGILHSRKYTEYSRVILALTAIGKNPENVGGYNLLMPLGDFDKTIWQGINGAIWALIALDSGNYQIPQNTDAETQATREMYIDEILKNQFPEGGWGLNKNAEADSDITGMALTALSGYRDKEGVDEAIDKGLSYLSSIQNENGGFESIDTDNSESTSQILVALAALKIDVNDPRFVSNGKTVLDSLLSFKNQDHSFKNIHGENGANLMATEQCLYALVAYNRMITGESFIYNMADVIKQESGEENEKPTLYEYVHKMPVVNKGKTFEDISGHQSKKEIEALACRNIINGKGENLFEPDSTMTRAEFATIVVKSLGMELSPESKFSDVTPNDWHYLYVSTASLRGIVNGISDWEFNPNGVITKEEAAVMVSRAAKLCEMKIEYDDFSVRNILAPFADYVSSSHWARSSLAFCYDKGILDDTHINIDPKKYVTRAEIAVMLYNLLDLASLL